MGSTLAIAGYAFRTGLRDLRVTAIALLALGAAVAIGACPCRSC